MPFVAQTPALCGGASAAMVMRYWGDGSAAPEAFAPLIDDASDGIRAADLTEALGRRGYTTRAFGANPSLARRELERGRPLILLIDGGEQLHYVVLLAWGSGSVLYHDPARGPYRLVSDGNLLAAWEASGYLAILALPPVSFGVSSHVPREEPEPVSACSELVAAARLRAHEDDLDAAERGLELATWACPDSGLAWRELAGVSFRRSAWPEAVSRARRSLALGPDDPLAWRILGASQFLVGDDSAALDAWNQVGEPSLERTNVSQAKPDGVAFDERRLGLELGGVLTASAYRRAERRLAEQPIALRARLALRPLPGGRAELDVALLERPRAPSGRMLVARTVAGVVAEREVAIELAGLLGRAEVLRFGGRFWRNRPAAWGSIALPAPGSGVATLEVAWEEQSYAEPAGAVRREQRRRASIRWHDWIAPDLRLDVTTSLDRFDAGRVTPGLAASLDRRLLGDLVSIRGRGAAWVGPDSFQTYRLDAGWRSTTRRHERVVRLRGGVRGASRSAPLALWSGAGTGHGRDILLRAHPLLADGVIAGEVFGRSVAHAGLELESGGWRLGPTRMGALLFADWARGPRGNDSGRLTSQVDVGLGVRLTVPGAGTLRLDAALGLRGGSAVSIGLSPPWPNQ